MDPSLGVFTSILSMRYQLVWFLMRTNCQSRPKSPSRRLTLNVNDKSHNVCGQDKGLLDTYLYFLNLSGSFANNVFRLIVPHNFRCNCFNWTKLASFDKLVVFRDSLERAASLPASSRLDEDLDDHSLGSPDMIVLGDLEFGTNNDTINLTSLFSNWVGLNQMTKSGRRKDSKWMKRAAKKDDKWRRQLNAHSSGSGESCIIDCITGSPNPFHTHPILIHFLMAWGYFDTHSHCQPLTQGR